MASWYDRLHIKQRQLWVPIAFVAFIFLFENTVSYEDIAHIFIENTVRDESDDRNLNEITASIVCDLLKITTVTVIDAEKLEVAIIDVIVDADDDADPFYYFFSLVDSLAKS